MRKILTLKEAAQKARGLKNTGERIILTGGCFDILHVGHLKFLEEAKKLKGCLFVLLESDKKVKEIKGKTRPFNGQKERALLLASLSPVDAVVLLPFLHKNHEYDKIVTQMSPDVFAVSEDDPGIEHKKRQARELDAEIKVVTRKIKNRSTTRVSKLIIEENGL